MKSSKPPVRRYSIFFFLTFILVLSFSPEGAAFNFPAAAWHRGDATFAQENSRAALAKALDSVNPNIELDIIDFVDARGNRVGLVSHDYLMKRATGAPGAFGEKYNDVSELPQNAANPQLPPQPFMTVVDLFELIKATKARGVTPMVSLDMKEEGKNAELSDYWKNKRHVKFVGVFAYNKNRAYTNAQWALLKKVDWIELDPPQMRQYIQMKTGK